MANPNRLEGHIFEKIVILRAKIWTFSKDLPVIDFALGVKGVLESKTSEFFGPYFV
jgi:hypothetical protein